MCVTRVRSGARCLVVGNAWVGCTIVKTRRVHTLPTSVHHHLGTREAARAVLAAVCVRDGIYATYSVGGGRRACGGGGRGAHLTFFFNYYLLFYFESIAQCYAGATWAQPLDSHWAWNGCARGGQIE